MTILALDLGTTTGWAIGDGSFVEYGAQQFTLHRGESPGMRFLAFRSWLRKMISDYRVALVAYEQPHLRGGSATDLLVGFATRVQEEAAVAGIEHVAIHTATLKKWATGNGRASKEEMVARAAQMYGSRPQSDDEADALLLLGMVAEEYKLADLGQ